MIDLVGRLLPLALAACFAVFLVIIFKGPGRVTGKRDKNPGVVRLGVLLQSVAYMFPWMFRRSWVNPFGGAALWPVLLIALASLAAALGAIALAREAKKHLGRQWALAARVIEGHVLVTDGPFGRVRHPLYLSMGILQLAAVIGLASPIGAALTAGLFGWGTALRVRAEDRLLAETFGREFEEYRRRVPAFFPRFKHMD